MSRKFRDQSRGCNFQLNYILFTLISKLILYIFYSLIPSDVNQLISSLQVEINELFLLVEGLTINLQSLSTEVNQIKTRVDTIYPMVFQMEEDIQVLSTTVQMLIVEIDSLKHRMTEAETKISTLETKVHQLETSVAALEASVSTLQGEVEALTKAVSDLQVEVGVMSSAIATLQGQVSDLEADYDHLDANKQHKLNAEYYDVTNTSLNTSQINSTSYVTLFTINKNSDSSGFLIFTFQFKYAVTTPSTPNYSFFLRMTCAQYSGNPMVQEMIYTNNIITSPTFGSVTFLIKATLFTSSPQTYLVQAKTSQTNISITFANFTGYVSHYQ